MKVIIVLLLTVFCAFIVQAQENPNKKKPVPFYNKKPGQQHYPFGSSPQFKLPGPETPAFTDSLNINPGDKTGAHIYVKNLPDYFNMPVWKPGPEFSSNMPIKVPDSTVHYFILKKKFDRNLVKPEGKN